MNKHIGTPVLPFVEELIDSRLDPLYTLLKAYSDTPVYSHAIYKAQRDFDTELIRLVDTLGMDEAEEIWQLCTAKLAKSEGREDTPPRESFESLIQHVRGCLDATKTRTGS
jgi:hypothetical protein